MSSSDRSAQIEEIDTLKAIYYPEELQAHENEKGLFEVNTWATVELPEGYQIQYVDNLDEWKPLYLTVEHLPPIQIQMTLPPDYPSRKMPYVTLSCEWLRLLDRLRLEGQLRSLWKQNLQCPIIYIWTEYLKTDTLCFLNITELLDITLQAQRQLNSLAGLAGMPAKNDSFSETLLVSESTDDSGMIAGASSKTEKSLNSDWCIKTRQKRRNLSRTTTKKKDATQRRPLIQILEAYDREQRKASFLKSFHMCEICLTEKMGKECALFEKCGHVFCRNCLGSYFSQLIKEGNVAAIKCPAYQCDTEATQTQVRELVDSDLFEKYDRTLLSTTLDTMTDIVYCPRALCRYPVTREPEERLAMCPNCQYAFCIYCKMGYHGVEPCRFKADERRKLVEKYQEASKEEKDQMEAKYGKKQLQILVDNTLSEFWIQDNGKNCPQCNVVIEKSEGCNKMTCWRCKSFFCWLCGTMLKPAEPYLHYRDPKSPCNNLLFQFNSDDEDDWGGIEDFLDADSGASDLEAGDTESDIE